MNLIPRSLLTEELRLEKALADHWQTLVPDPSQREDLLRRLARVLGRHRHARDRPPPIVLRGDPETLDGLGSMLRASYPGQVATPAQQDTARASVWILLAAHPDAGIHLALALAQRVQAIVVGDATVHMATLLAAAPVFHLEAPKARLENSAPTVRAFRRHIALYEPAPLVRCVPIF